MKRMKTLVSGAFAAFLFQLSTLTVFATDNTTATGSATTTGSGDFASSALAQGTKNLISDISVWFIVICALAGTASAIYCLIRRGMADEVDGKMWTKRCVTAIICAVAGALIGGIVSLIGSYYGA